MVHIIKKNDSFFPNLLKSFLTNFAKKGFVSLIFNESGKLTVFALFYDFMLLQ